MVRSGCSKRREEGAAAGAAAVCCSSWLRCLKSCQSDHAYRACASVKAVVNAAVAGAVAGDERAAVENALNEAYAHGLATLLANKE